MLLAIGFQEDLPSHRAAVPAVKTSLPAQPVVIKPQPKAEATRPEEKDFWITKAAKMAGVATCVTMVVAIVIFSLNSQGISFNGDLPGHVACFTSVGLFVGFMALSILSLVIQNKMKGQKTTFLENIVKVAIVVSLLGFGGALALSNVPSLSNIYFFGKSLVELSFYLGGGVIAIPFIFVGLSSIYTSMKEGIKELRKTAPQNPHKDIKQMSKAPDDPMPEPVRDPLYVTQTPLDIDLNVSVETIHSTNPHFYRDGKKMQSQERIFLENVLKLDFTRAEKAQLLELVSNDFSFKDVEETVLKILNERMCGLFSQDRQLGVIRAINLDLLAKIEPLKPHFKDLCYEWTPLSPDLSAKLYRALYHARDVAVGMQDGAPVSDHFNYAQIGGSRFVEYATFFERDGALHPFKIRIDIETGKSTLYHWNPISSLPEDPQALFFS